MSLVNLQGLWQMEEASSALVDSENANNLTGAWTRSTTHVRGSFAALFAEQKVSLADASLSADFPGKNAVSPTSLSIGGWVRLTATPGTVMYLCDKGACYSLYTNADSKLVFECGNGGTTKTVTGNSALSANTFYHVQCRASTANGVMDMIVDNVKQTDSGAKSLTTLAGNSTAFTLAGDDGTSNNLQGYLDEFFVFDDMLSDADAALIYAGSLFGTPPAPGGPTIESFLDDVGVKPISWWMFEDAATPALDGNTTNNNDITWGTGAAQSATHKRGSFSYLTGSLDGTASYASLSANFPFKAAVTDCTIGGWFRTPGTTANRPMLFFNVSSTSGFSIDILNSTGVARGAIFNGSTNRITGDADIRDDAWHHAVLRWQGSTDDELSFWVDGVKDADTLLPATAVENASSAVLRLGNGGGVDTIYYDEWFISDVALTDAQIASIYTYGLGGATLGLDTQPSTTATSGTAFAQQPKVQLKDIDGTAVTTADIPITASLATGSGTLSGTLTINTDVNGEATFTNLVITGTGAHTIVFNTSGSTGVTSGTVTVAAAATKLGVTTQPSSVAESGEPFAQQPAIQLLDAENIPVSTAAVTITASKASGTGTLGGTLTANTDAAGLATFTNLEIVGDGEHTLNFASAGLTSVVSAVVDVSVATTATKLVMTTQPSTIAASSAAFAQQPVVQLQDAGSSPVAESGIVVTASIASGTGSLGLPPLTATTDANGTATFTSLSIVGDDDHTMDFDSGSLTTATSNTITVASTLLVNTAPSASVGSGVPFPTQPVIKLALVDETTVALSGVTVTAAIFTGTGTLSGVLTAVTNGSGLATFTNLVIFGDGEHVLRFSADGLTSIDSGILSINGATLPIRVFFVGEIVGSFTVENPIRIRT